MKYCFLAIQVNYTGQCGIDGRAYNNGKTAMFAYAETLKAGENLVFHLGNIGGLVSATLCETRKQADELVSAWNAGFRDSGIYAF